MVTVAVDPELLELMPSVVTLTPADSLNAYSERTAATVGIVSPRCHIEYTGHWTSGSPTDRVWAMATVYLDDVYPVTQDWTIVLPVNAAIVSPFIAEVEQLFDEVGPYSTVLHLGAKGHG